MIAIKCMFMKFLYNSFVDSWGEVATFVLEWYAKKTASLNFWQLILSVVKVMILISKMIDIVNILFTPIL